MIDIARENRRQTGATQRTPLVESYFGLRLAQEVVQVRQETYRSLQRHYENALKPEAQEMTEETVLFNCFAVIPDVPTDSIILYFAIIKLFFLRR